MSRLTAERAQERIAHLKQWQAQRGLTLREEEYLEALEMACKILCATEVITERESHITDMLGIEQGLYAVVKI